MQKIFHIFFEIETLKFPEFSKIPDPKKSQISKNSRFRKKSLASSREMIVQAPQKKG